jgi:central glycolytic genes regulator
VVYYNRWQEKNIGTLSSIFFVWIGTKIIHRDFYYPGGVTELKNLLMLEKKIVPEMLELLEKRYQILKSIYYNQPIGRRALSQELVIGERIVRTEVNFLKDQGLVDINSIGMMVTKDGEAILDSLEKIIHEINGLSSIEEQLQKYLGVIKVIVVPGEVDNDNTVIKEMGRIAAGYIKKLIDETSIITLTGGTSVEQVVDNFPRMSRHDALVVPARGGIGRDVETQASTLAAKLAHKLGSNYKMLHVPDNLSHEALETMMNEPDIRDTIENISKADILIFGIGRADDMSKRRGLTVDQTQELLDKGAVAEAFGYYFNKDGDVIFKTPTMALKFDDVKNIKNIVAISGGANKAEAIIATKTYNSAMILVTDEGAAKEMLKIILSS